MDINQALELQITTIIESVLHRYLGSQPNKPEAQFELYTTKEAAGILKVDTQVVRRMCREGQIGCRKVCGGYRISKQDITEYLNRNR